jgi:hypothetical protein
MKRISVTIEFVRILQPTTLTSVAQNYTSKMLKIFLILLTPTLMLSCDKQSLLPYIKGSGIIVTEQRDTDNFSSVELRLAGNVEVSEDDRFRLMVSADDNIIGEINTFTRNGTLIISSNRNFKDATIDMHISLPSLEKIAVNSSGDIMVGDFFPDKEMNFRIGGSGSITVKVKSEKIYSTIAGSGSLNLSGTAYLNSIEISGSGTINSYELNTSVCQVNVNGSGNCFVSVEDSLKVRINGSGNVYYRGTPQIDSIITGSGKIINTD